MGGDYEDIAELCGEFISIRTPAWGVTTLEEICGWFGVFQFAPPHGG